MKPLITNSGNSVHILQNDAYWFYPRKITIKTFLCFCLFLIFLLVNISTVNSQNYSKIDSLKNIVKSLPELNYSEADTTRLLLCMRIGEEFEKLRLYDSALYWYKNIADNPRNFLEPKAFPQRSKIIAITLNNIGWVTRAIDQENYIEAAKYYRLSLKISEQINFLSAMSSSYNNLGTIEDRLGNYDEAKKYYTLSLEIDEETGNHRGIAISLMNIGHVNNYQGNYQQTIVNYERSLNFIKQIGDKRLMANCLHGLGLAARNLGNYKKAIDYYEESLKLNEEIGNIGGVFQSLNSIGIVYGEHRKSDEALQYFNKALLIAQESGQKSPIAQSYLHIGNVLRHSGDIESAYYYYKKALEITEEIGLKQGTSHILNNLGLMYFEQEEYLMSINYFEKSLEIKNELGLLTELTSGYVLIANSYVKIGRHNDAYYYYMKANNNIIEMLRNSFSILSEKEKEQYLKTAQWIFDNLNYYSFSQTTFDERFSDLSYNNELVLKGLLLKSSKAIIDAVHNSDDNVVRETYFAYKQIVDKISSVGKLPPEQQDSTLELYYNQANELEVVLVRSLSEFADLQKLFDIKWQNVQKELIKGEAAIEFVHFEDINKNKQYAALVITHDSSKPIAISLFAEEELENIIGLISYTGHRFIDGLYGSLNDYNSSLYKLVWEPLEVALTGIHTVYYAPVGVLNKISFSALGVNPGTTLCDKYNLFQLSSTGNIVDNKSYVLNKNSNAVVIGGIDYGHEGHLYEQWPFLEGALIEKELLVKLLSDNNIKTNSFSGKNANEESFKSLFLAGENQPNLLHIATHGFFFPDPETTTLDISADVIIGEVDFRGVSWYAVESFISNKDPLMRSGLVFAGVNDFWRGDKDVKDDDGVMTALEVINIDLRNNFLMVLSACETGLGDIAGSEGVYGLQRAFKMAGTDFVIMSLWQVPDIETALFMEKFYNLLVEKNNLREAFRQTQREMRQKYDPFFWAAFVLVE